MNKEIIEESIKFINERDNVTFVELINHLNELKYNIKGEYNLYFRDNIILWSGLSKDFIEIYNELLKEFDMRTCNPIVYSIDGEYIKLPIADINKLNKGIKYKKSKWLPLTFNIKRGVLK